MPDQHTERLIGSAPADHDCEQCGKGIAGKPAVEVVGTYEGERYHHFIHPECEAAAKAYAKIHTLWGEDWPWFQHEEYGFDDWRWMTTHHPVVAKRLGWDVLLAEALADAAEDA